MDLSKDIQQNTNKQIQSVIYKQKYKKLLAMMGQRKNISGETMNGTIDRKNPDKGVVNILLTTHGARLRCFVDQVCETYDKNIDNEYVKNIINTFKYENIKKFIGVFDY